MRPIKQSNSMKELLKKLKRHDTLVLASGVIATTLLCGAFVYVTTPAISADAAKQEVRRDSLGVQKKASSQLKEIEDYLEKLDKVVTESSNLVQEIQTVQNEQKELTEKTLEREKTLSVEKDTHTKTEKETSTDSSKVVESINGLDKDLKLIHSEISSTSEQVKKLKESMDKGGNTDANKDKESFAQITNALDDIKKSCDKSGSNASGIIEQIRDIKTNNTDTEKKTTESLQTIIKSLEKVDTKENLTKLENDLKITQATYINMLSDVSKDVGKTNDNVKKVRESVSKVMDRVGDVDNNINKVRDVQETTNSKVDDVRGTQNVTNSKIDDVRGTQDTTNNKIDDVRGTQDTTNNKIDDVRGTQDTTNNKIDDVRGTQDTTNNKIDDVRGTQNVTNSKVDEVRKAQDETNSKVDGIRGTQDETNSKVDNIREVQDVTNDKIDKVNENLNETNLKVDDVRETQNVTNDKVDKVHDTQNETNSKVDEVRENQYGTNGKIDEVRVAQEGTDSKIQDVRNAQDGTNSKIDDVKNAQSSTDSKIDEVRNAQAGTNSKIDEIKRSQSGTDGRITTIVRNVDTVSADVASMNKSLSEMKSKLENNEKQMKQLASRLDQVFQSSGSNRSKLASILSDLGGYNAPKDATISSLIGKINLIPAAVIKAGTKSCEYHNHTDGKNTIKGETCNHSGGCFTVAVNHKHTLACYNDKVVFIYTPKVRVLNAGGKSDVITTNPKYGDEIECCECHKQLQSLKGHTHTARTIGEAQQKGTNVIEKNEKVLICNKTDKTPEYWIPNCGYTSGQITKMTITYPKKYNINPNVLLSKIAVAGDREIDKSLFDFDIDGYSDSEADIDFEYSEADNYDPFEGLIPEQNDNQCEEQNSESEDNIKNDEAVSDGNTNESEVVHSEENVDVNAADSGTTGDGDSADSKMVDPGTPAEENNLDINADVPGTRKEENNLEADAGETQSEVSSGENMETVKFNIGDLDFDNDILP